RFAPMAMPTFGSLEIRDAGNDKAPDNESPFRIAILGDFSGRGTNAELRDAKSLAKIKPLLVTRDALDSALAKLKVALPVTVDNEKAVLSFSSLEDFHPDQIVSKVTAFDFLDEEEKTTALRNILHAPGFQTLETAWLGVDWLLKRIQKKESG